MIDNELIKTFNRRTFIITGVKLFALFYLIIKLFKLQVIDYKKYKKQSDKNSLRIRFIIPPRGVIYDRNDIVMASNQRKYFAYIIAEETIKNEDHSLTQVLRDLSSYLKLQQSDLQTVLSDIENQKKFLPVLIQEDLNWDQMAKLESNHLNLPGVFVEEETIRYYPQKKLGCHLIGYVSKAEKSDLGQKDLFLEKLPNFKIGKTGLEKQFDEMLRGTPGESYQLVNAYGRTVHTVEEEERLAVPGKNIKLTIDQRLQEHTSSIITEKSGAAILMDVNTGEILSMTSFPEYDLSIFEGSKTSKDEYKKLQEDEYKPLINKAISGQYAPGSTLKVITALSALENKIITPEKKVHCPGHFIFGNHKYHCWRDKEGHGWQNMTEAIANSCDVYFYKLALELGIDNIERTALKFGLSVKTDLDLLNEKDGIFPGQIWKAKRLGEQWYPSDTIITAIGQGYTLCTPIQLAQMTARLANGQKAITPRIIQSSKPFNFKDLNVDPKYLKTIYEGMYGVMNKGGTASYYGFNYKGMQIAGKTGTTQVRRITESERKTGKLNQEQLQYMLRNHALFVGYAPYINPRFAVSVVVEHGRSGTIAAAMGSSILKKALELYS